MSYDIAYITESYAFLIGLNDRTYIHGEAVYINKKKRRKKKRSAVTEYSWTTQYFLYL